VSAPTALYSATRERGLDTYTLTIELSDDPGSTVILGCSKGRCEQEVSSLSGLGYEVVSKVYGRRGRNGNQG
jgi:hypothetical protein